MKIPFRLNGRDVLAEAEPGERLLHVLREDFGLASLKGSCHNGSCGFCSVLIDGEFVPSCMVPVFSIFRKSILTLEGFKETEDFADIEKGFLHAGTRPCPSCVSAKVLAAHILLSEDPSPSESAIRKAFSGILCRCTDPTALVEGVMSASTYRRLRSHGRKI